MTKAGRMILGLIALAVLASFGFVYAGAYNIAADAPHSAFGLTLLRTVKQRSVHAHARGILVPKLADDPSRLGTGAQHYAAMCADCHLAPGMADSELRRGLYPEPPNLVTAEQVNPAEAFWVIKHGIKLTAMPAWGPTHDDETIWSMVALVQRLPSLTAEDYRSLLASGAGDQAPEHHEPHGDHVGHHAEEAPVHEEGSGHAHENGHHHD